MSLLLIDIGNTAIHWATKPAGQSLSAMQTCSYHNETITELLTAQWSRLETVSAVVISSVATESINQSVQQWLQRHWRVTPQFIRAEASGHGIQNAYREPQRLGTDRWAAMVAAYGLSQKTCCVLDCGTAVTFDAIDATGRHLGGWIMPGYHLFCHTLAQETAAINASDEVISDISSLGRNTQQCVNFAWHHGILGLLERSLPLATSSDLSCFVTGGDATRLLPLLEDKWCYANDLVLQGLAIIASSK